MRGNDGSLVFCCARCEGEWRDRRRAGEVAGQAVISAMIARLHRRFAPITITDTHHYTTIRDGLPTTHEARVGFSWPGQKIGDAVFHLQRDYYSPGASMLPPAIQVRCCMGDREAFEKFAEECRG